MLIKFISWAVRHRLMVLLASALIAVGGIIGLRNLAIDAFPDTTPVQIQVNTVAPALVATEIERLITFPIEMLMGGMPGLTNVRSVSQFGTSIVTLTFEDGTNIWAARAIVDERLASLKLPDGVPRPIPGPVATGLGEVLHYLIVPDASKGPPADLMDLRTAQNWIVRPELRAVPGTADVNSWGGYEKQYQIRIDPTKLFSYDLTFQQILNAVRTNNLNVGGGYIDRQGDMLLIHGIGRTDTIPKIESIVIDAREGTPVYLRDVAEVVVSHELRRGMVTANGNGEVVLGLGFMRIGESSYDVTQRMAKQLDETANGLPEGMKVVPVYNRTELVDNVIQTVKGNLFEGALFVIAILFIFLGNLRAGLIAAATIPLAMLFAFMGMWPAGIAGTLLSLGAIDFGIVVDSSVVMLENIMQRLAHAQEHGDKRSREEIIREAAIEVRTPTVFGQIIIMIVYLPILALEGVEGKMFRPMALTVMLVLAGSLFLALTLTPTLAYYFLPKKIEEKDVSLVRLAKRAYAPMLAWVLKARVFTVTLGGMALAAAFWLVTSFGAEFVPQLSEGAIVIGALRTPGTSLEQAVKMNTMMEKYILTNYPDEVKNVWSRVGEPEISMDAGSSEVTDMFVTLHPRSHWKKAKQQRELVDLLSKDLKRFKGQTIWFTQPIEMRLNEMLTGSRADLALKLFGQDLDTLITKSKELETILKSIPGCADLTVEQVSGQPILQVRVDQQQLTRYGVSAETVMDIVESVSGKQVGDVVEDQLRFPLAIRLAEPFRRTVEDLSRVEVTAPMGDRIPLSRLANIVEVRGPKLISSEWGKRRISINCNVRGRDIGSFVAEAQQRIEKEFKLPPVGYRLKWGGQFENMQRAQQRLAIVVPIALMLIVLLLYVTYRSPRDTFIVFISVPFACVGGIIGLWIREMPISVSAAVGFITLSGVSVLNSMIVVSYLRTMMAKGIPTEEAIRQTSMTCLRTVMMTSLVASVGFIPMAFNTGTGAEVQRPLATVVIGGVMSSTLMTLFILPALYSLMATGFSSKRGDAEGSGEDEPQAVHELEHSLSP